MLKTHWIQLEIKHRKQEEVEHVYSVVCITNALYFWRSLHLTRRRRHFTNTGGQPEQFPSDRFGSWTGEAANLWESPRAAMWDRGPRSHIPCNDLAMASDCYPPSGHRNDPSAADFHFQCLEMLQSRWCHAAGQPSSAFNDRDCTQSSDSGHWEAVAAGMLLLAWRLL